MVRDLESTIRESLGLGRVEDVERNGFRYYPMDSGYQMPTSISYYPLAERIESVA